MSLMQNYNIQFFLQFLKNLPLAYKKFVFKIDEKVYMQYVKNTKL